MENGKKLDLFLRIRMYTHNLYLIFSISMIGLKSVTNTINTEHRRPLYHFVYFNIRRSSVSTLTVYNKYNWHRILQSVHFVLAVNHFRLREPLLEDIFY